MARISDASIGTIVRVQGRTAIAFTLAILEIAIWKNDKIGESNETFRVFLVLFHCLPRSYLECRFVDGIDSHSKRK